MGSAAGGQRIRPGRLAISHVPSRGPTRHVFVTGAGFTRAFVPAAPLLVDDFGNEGLVEKVRGLPRASQLLEAKRNRHPDGFIDIERLMTRLHEPMPYDRSNGATDEYAFLLAELKRAFLRRLHDAMNGASVEGDVIKFANHCVAINATCITFNYDDFLDAALQTTRRWNPWWGYGFFCQPAARAISDASGGTRGYPELQILKLHGSVSWWPRLGYSEPFPLDAIVHHHNWEDIFSRHPYRRDVAARHLGPEPVIGPPVLSKAGLASQPVLDLVWTLAFEQLSTAEAVTFIGYSFPPNDMAARILFAEALRDLPPENIHVIDHKEESHWDGLKQRYRSVLGNIPDECFCFDGAISWLRQLADNPNSA